MSRAVSVGTVAEITAAGRKRAVIEGRDIVVISHRGHFYALDSFCYRLYHFAALCQYEEEEDIVILSHRGHFYALNSLCYHAGGPLHEGDIEDMGSNPCVVCPWHKYKIALSNGHGFYMAVDPFNPGKAPELKSKGAKQRTHTVLVQQGQVMVTLSSGDIKLDSDHYNCAEYRLKFNLR
ncbi:hypothetical protein ACOMHN_003149 [Nucella lapillus]